VGNNDASKRDEGRKTEPPGGEEEKKVKRGGGVILKKRKSVWKILWGVIKLGGGKKGGVGPWRAEDKWGGRLARVATGWGKNHKIKRS